MRPRGQNQAVDRALLERGASALGPIEQGLTGLEGGGGTEGEGTQRALMMSSFPREPVNMVMTVGNKADGILVGTDGKYSSIEASFR